jgi:hypothetical protein
VESFIEGYKIKEDGMDRVCSTYGKMRNSYKILVRKHGGKRQLGRPRYRW